jgi:uncharacterized protein
MEYPQYDPASPDSPLSDAELDAFDALLQSLPREDAMNIEVMDGYVTALAAGPPAVLARLRTRDWLPAVWGGDGEGTAPFASGRQRKRATVLVLRHLQSIACRLRDAPADWQPVFSLAETQGRELADAEDWCIGFLQAVALAPDAWAAVFDDAELAAALRPIVFLGGDEADLDDGERAALQDADRRDEASRAVADAVVALHARLHGRP